MGHGAKDDMSIDTENRSRAADEVGAAAGGRTVGLPFILLLVAVSAVSPLALNIFVPSMPGMRAVFAVDFATVQLTLSLYLAGMAVSQLAIGPLSDRYGRRPVLLAGLAIFVLASIACALAPSIEVLIVGRVLQAAGGCAGIVLSRAIVRDLFDRERAAGMIGYVTMGMALAPMASPAVGGVIELVAGWRTTFGFVALVGLLILALAVRRLPETHLARTEGSAGGLLASWGSLARSGQYWGYTLTAAFGSSCFFALVSGGAFVMTEVLDRNPAEYGFYFPLVGAGYILGNFTTGRVAAKVGTRGMIAMGNASTLLGIGAMAGLFAAGADHPLSLFGPMFLVGLGNGLMLPSAIAGAISVRLDLSGAAAGLAGTFQIGFGALVSPLVGWLLADTVWPLVAIMGAGAVLAVASSVLIRDEPRTGSAP